MKYTQYWKDDTIDAIYHIKETWYDLWSSKTVIGKIVLAPFLFGYIIPLWIIHIPIALILLLSDIPLGLINEIKINKIPQ